MYLAIWHSPKSLKHYSILIITSTTTDLLTSVGELFGQTRLIVSSWKVIALASYGPCKYLGSSTCYISQMITAHFLMHEIYLLLVSFWYRYFILRNGAPSKSRIIIVLIIAYIPSFIQGVSASFAADPPQDVQKILNFLFPHYILNEVNISGIVDLLKPQIIFMILNMTVAMSCIYVAMILLRSKILRILEKMSSLSRETRLMHEQLLKALTVQALLPMLFLVGSTSFLTSMFDIFHHPLLEYSIMASAGTIASLSPLATIVFVKPYRAYFKRHFVKNSDVSLPPRSLRSISVRMEFDGSFIFNSQPVLLVFGLFINSLLLYLAACQTPEPMKRYSILIIAFALCDLGTSIGELVSRSRIVVFPRTLAVFSSGVCAYAGPTACYISQSITAHFLIYTVYLIFVSFGYRYYVIYYGPMSARTILITIAISYIPSFFQVVIYSFASDDPEVVLEVVKNRFPHYNLTGIVVSGSLDYFDPCVSVLSVHMTLPIPFLYTGILYLRRKVLWKLESLSENMSIYTKSMHEQLLKALTFQAMLPALFAIGSGCFVVAALDLYHHPFLEHMVLTTCCLTPAISPLGSIFFIRPYRQFVTHCQSFTAHLLVYTVYLMFVSFAYRYYIIYHGPMSARKIVILIAVSYIPSFIQMLVYCSAGDEPELVLEAVKQRFPHYNLTGIVVSGNLNYLKPSVLYMSANMTIPIPFLYAGILYFRKKVLLKLQSLTENMSLYTKTMHEQLLKALTFQAMLPAMFSIGTTCFVLATFDIVHHPFLEHLILTTCCVTPAVSPLGSIFFIRPYREFVTHWFKPRGSQWRMELDGSFIFALQPVLVIFGFFLNSFQLYLAIFKTPEPLRRYSILIIAFALTDIGTSVGEMVGRTRMVASPQALGMVSIGLCTYGGPISCYIWQSITGHFLIYSVYLMFVSFGYRYYVIYHGPTSVKAILMSIGISYIPSFIQVVVHCLAMDDPELVRQAVQRRFPQYNLTNTVVSGNLDYSNPAVLYVSIHMTCTSPFLYAGILYFRRKVLQKLDSLSGSLSSQTKSMHEQLLKALTFQAMLPALFAIGSGSFGIAALDIAHNLFLEHLVLSSCCASPALSPLGSILFIRPYRNFVTHRLLRRRSSHIESNLKTIEIY
ncbi:unnamed protein product [Caenorhabditis auriculariae]|uniref:G protein-coupled receptor n=1 Tax=Caenorhabditis auriculariae TaxID=2777116 RepID=A0A8S1HAH4_9PELO|nr:unnamed protein product [Caenorhabditis auriculariae]